MKTSQGNQVTICLEKVRWNQGRKEEGRRTKRLLRKSPTSSVVDGPPIFMKTIAVGPFDPVESCVTGGTGVANERNWFALPRCHDGVLVSFEMVDCDALFVSWLMGVLKAILMM